MLLCQTLHQTSLKKYAFLTVVIIYWPQICVIPSSKTLNHKSIHVFFMVWFFTTKHTLIQLGKGAQSKDLSYKTNYKLNFLFTMRCFKDLDQLEYFPKVCCFYKSYISQLIAVCFFLFKGLFFSIRHSIYIFYFLEYKDILFSFWIYCL